ncbi:MAG TPA: IS4 family transposase [Gammaproteobacteria bacterium]|nr:IS4 family transposase [Gammaproteobacteria bacterium]
MHTISKSRTIQQKILHQRVKTTDSHQFFNLLTAPDLLDAVEQALPDHRERLFPPTEALSMFLAQALSQDSSCQKVVNDAALKRVSGGLPVCSTRTGAYCKARQRLPQQMVSALVQQTGRLAAERVSKAWQWQNRPVRLIDGTTITMPDTAANQSAFPQQSTQQPGLGFPIGRIVGITCLSSGVVLNAAMGRYSGKGGSEQALLRGLLETFSAGDIALGDSYYCTYFLIAALRERGVDVVFEQHGSRRQRTDFRTGERLGERDHRVTWPKPKLKPDWMPQAQYDAAPDSLTLRELKVGGKILVTSMTCAKGTPKPALKALYRSRWHVELDLRSIKTTLGMEVLRCRTPEMNEKEMWVYLLAYNLIRLLMADAASLSDVLPRQLSFKHTLQLWLGWRQQSGGCTDENQVRILLLLIAQTRVGNRTGRVEPRAVKRRPKPFPLLSTPRKTARQEIRKIGHP